MNKKFMTAFMMALNVLSVCSYADQVQINITGKVMTKTCTIFAGSKDFLVNMSPENIRNASVGVPFSATSFAINMEVCPSNIRTVHVSFSAESDSFMPNLIKTSSGSISDATGIAIGLYDSEQRNIDIRNNSTDFVVDHEKPIKTFSFSAAYLKTNDNALPGKVNSFAYFEISYD